ncbi:MAG: hypothetical protein OFPII_25000 [Osedax symbiont Rs1]|nr:MAG: hypothetical protein OFPII_25000 [Osedax symbiont Rs1]
MNIGENLYIGKSLILSVLVKISLTFSGYAGLVKRFFIINSGWPQH